MLTRTTTNYVIVTGVLTPELECKASSGIAGAIATFCLAATAAALAEVRLTHATHTKTISAEVTSLDKFSSGMRF